MSDPESPRPPLDNVVISGQEVRRGGKEDEGWRIEEA